MGVSVTRHAVRPVLETTTRATRSMEPVAWGVILGTLEPFVSQVGEDFCL